MTAPARAATRILIVNQTVAAEITHGQVDLWTHAIAAQAREFAAAWGISGVTVDHALAATAQAHAASGRVETVIYLLDNADQADALGYHSEDDHGVTYGRVFAVDCQTNGVPVPSCLSHEVLEAIADLNVDRWVSRADGVEYALEVCDPVESDTYIGGDGVPLSDYVLPAWFDDTPPAGARFDRLGKLTGPFTLSRGGYAITLAQGQIRQVFGDRAHYDSLSGWRHTTKTHPLARTARRLAEVAGGKPGAPDPGAVPPHL